MHFYETSLHFRLSLNSRVFRIARNATLLTLAFKIP